MLPKRALPRLSKIIALTGPDSPKNALLAAVTPTAAAVSCTHPSLVEEAYAMHAAVYFVMFSKVALAGKCSNQKLPSTRRK